MSKIRIAVVMAVFFAGLLLVAPVVASLSLADSDDSLQVTNPRPNQYVKNNVNTKFKFIDDDQAQIPFEVTLRNNKCTTVISLIQAAKVNSGQEKTVTWDSNGPLQSVSSISDGKYCLEVCGSFKNGNKKYSACNSRFVNIRNNNGKPRITTSVPGDRTIFVDQSWAYDVNATDPEGDRLKFSLAKGPSFASINPHTGYLSVSGNKKNPGKYDFKIKVADGFGGTATQSFTLKVEKRPQPEPSSTSSSSSSSSVSSETSITTSSDSSLSQELLIEFLSPTAESELTGKQNKVEWSVTGLPQDSQPSITLMLLTDKEEILIAEWDDSDITEANLDVTGFDAGEYRLQLDIELEEEIFSQQSDVFTVVEQGEDGQDGKPNARPLIENIQPENEAVVGDLRPIITGEFVAPEGAQIVPETFEFILNNASRDFCDTTSQGFTCTPDVDLRPGKQQVRVAIEDDKNRLGVKEWTFVVEKNGSSIGGIPETIAIFGNEVPVRTLFLLFIACLVLIVLFFVPWVLLSMWRRRQPKQSNDGGANYTPPSGSDFDNNQVTTDSSDLVPVTEQYSQPNPTTSEDEISDPFSDSAGNTIPEPTTQSVPSPSGEIDPLKFDNYEDYLAAVGAAENANQSANTVNNDPSNENDAATDYISSPDYSELYSANPETSKQDKQD